MSKARVAELVYASDLKSDELTHEGSTPSSSTIPYSEYKVFGPYKHDDRRKFYILTRGKHNRKTISVARYNMERHLGRYLDKAEEVDHINEDKTDDRIENLQILSHKHNNMKSFYNANKKKYKRKYKKGNRLR